MISEANLRRLAFGIADDAEATGPFVLGRLGLLEGMQCLKIWTRNMMKL